MNLIKIIIKVMKQKIYHTIIRIKIKNFSEFDKIVPNNKNIITRKIYIVKR